jgi:hypothetical protein
LAAVEACGRGAMLSHYSAAAHFGFLDWDARDPEVTVRGAGTRAHRAIRVHRSSALAPRDAARCAGVPDAAPGGPPQHAPNVPECALYGVLRDVCGSANVCRALVSDAQRARGRRARPHPRWRVRASRRERSAAPLRSPRRARLPLAGAATRRGGRQRQVARQPRRARGRRRAPGAPRGRRRAGRPRHVAPGSRQAVRDARAAPRRRRADRRVCRPQPDKPRHSMAEDASAGVSDRATIARRARERPSRARGGGTPGRPEPRRAAPCTRGYTSRGRW